MKAMRCKDFRPKKLTYPVWVEPKIDGCRAFNPYGALLARSLKKHANLYTTAFYSKEEYIGLDGELAAADEHDPDLCRKTTSAISSVHGEPYTLWHVFDYITDKTKDCPYSVRYKLLKAYVTEMQARGLCGHLRVVPYIECWNMEEVQNAHDKYMEQGYEGSCIYLPDGLYKEGNCSPINGPVWRKKDFVDEEILVTGITEGEKNNNIAQTNELGHTFRTSHQENKVPNGQVGSIQGTIVKDSEYFKVGTEVTIATGTMTEADCIYYFENQSEIIGKIVKFKHFPKGIKDKPRFGQFQCIRSADDL